MADESTPTVIPSGNQDGRGISLQRRHTSGGDQVIVAHTCDGKVVEAVAMSPAMFAQLVSVGQQVAA